MAALLDRLKANVPDLLSGFAQSGSMTPLALEKAAMLARRNGSSYASVPLTSLLEEVGSLTPGSILVGACDDRLHFYMDLLDPRPGSILIAGERKVGQSRLLHSLLSSACLLNSHRAFRYAYIGADPALNAVLTRQAHCFRAVSVHTRASGELITQLADLAEKRIHPGQKDVQLILAIDGLDVLCSSLDDQTYDDLAWLIRDGPSLRIWPVATLDAARAQIVGDELIHLFGTRLLGHMDARHAALFQGEPSVTSQLLPGKQFCVWFDKTWLSFWIPVADLFYRA
jgi:hypothetical protein